MGGQPTGYKHGMPYFVCKKCGAKFYVAGVLSWCPHCEAYPFEWEQGGNPNGDGATVLGFALVLAYPYCEVPEEPVEKPPMEEEAKDEQGESPTTDSASTQLQTVESAS